MPVNGLHRGSVVFASMARSYEAVQCACFCVGTGHARERLAQRQRLVREHGSLLQGGAVRLLLWERATPVNGLHRGRALFASIARSCRFVGRNRQWRNVRYKYSGLTMPLS
ncbi:hypothetical protein BN1079_01936 [Pseudomonas saudiphocaensis]|uniref:Uncharacterized protein n=1 Tax=Pseudomonas saudiphocaensis TaxID=1499686 RepID=A0A078LQ11_9PSED|nr:hypothetical protein BN1079_01936 [Pseudomonas saudiphocaensis]